MLNPHGHSKEPQANEAIPMNFKRSLAGTAILLAAMGFAAAIMPAVSATDITPATAPKTYKRRCTNSKCKIVSESTKPIFKCPHCGSSTVPAN